MATYVNDLRLKEIGTGESSGTWGTETNTNLELIAEAFSYGTEASFGSDADATTTIADGATDPARSLYLKITSGVSLTATRTLTIAPNTVSKVWIIENATSGSQSINISQGSGANVTIPNGDVKVIYSDGAGSGAAVVDAFTDLNTSGTLTATNLAGTLSTAAQPNITSVGTLTGFTSTGIDDNADATAITIDSSENVTFAGGLIIPSTITHAGDTDTKLDFNQANTLRLITGDNTAWICNASSMVINEDSIDFDFRVESNGNANMLFVDGGNDRVGIGTGSPSYLLDVEGAAQFNNIVPSYNNSSGTGSSSNVWKLGTISLGNSTGAVITVLGTQSYSAGSQVAGKTEIVLRGQNAVTTLEGYFYGNTLGANTVSNVYWKNTGTNNEFEIWIKYGANFAGLDHYVETAGTWVSDVSDTGSTSAPAGSSGLSSLFTVTTGGSPRIRVDNDGLKFGSDTAAANALDDYEEGTFTITPNTGTVSSQVCKYSKVGGIVTFVVDFTVGTGGATTYTGLPFAPNSTTAWVPYVVGQTFASGRTYPTMVVGASGTSLIMRDCGSGQALSSMAVTAGATYHTCFSYTTDS